MNRLKLKPPKHLKYYVYHVLKMPFADRWLTATTTSTTTQRQPNWKRDVMGVCKSLRLIAGIKILVDFRISHWLYAFTQMTNIRITDGTGNWIIIIIVYAECRTPSYLFCQRRSHTELKGKQPKPIHMLKIQFERVLQQHQTMEKAVKIVFNGKL